MSAQYGVAMSWQQYVSRQLAGRPQAWLAVEVGVNPGTVSRWTRGEQSAEAGMAIKVARAVGDEPLAALVAAGYLTPEEAGATVVAEPDYSKLSNKRLLQLVEGRMTREAGAADDAAPMNDDDSGGATVTPFPTKPTGGGEAEVKQPRAARPKPKGGTQYERRTRRQEEAGEG